MSCPTFHTLTRVGVQYPHRASPIENIPSPLTKRVRVRVPRLPRSSLPQSEGEMALDLHQAAGQIQTMATHLRQRQVDWHARLQAGLFTLATADATRLEAKRQASEVRWPMAGVAASLGAKLPPPPLPRAYTVIGVDGSHIDVDRHSPARCYLINIGLCQITYGLQPDARLSSQPTLYTAAEDLVLTDPSSNLNRVPIDGSLLGLKRAVAEMEALADALEALPGDEPALGLLDGSLILWGLAGQAQPDFARRRILEEGLLPALDRLQQATASRPVAVASYISLPGSREVVDLLRLHHCPYEPANCDLYCRQVIPGQRGCDPVDGLLDRDLFAAHLEAGERSQVFVNHTSVVEERYGPHQVSFYYLNVGEEMGRVEVPAWVANDPQRLALTHALVLEQCLKGEGYPVALSESHEQAVVTGADRAYFEQLVMEALAGEGLPESTSQKSRSKRTRWV